MVFGWGNTSACAEKSRNCRKYLAVLGKYLRVRGEESQSAVLRLRIVEIPPRARRRDLINPYAATGVGNTSACAEKRSMGLLCAALTRKYLRVRGEEMNSILERFSPSEIPPRARRRGLVTPWWCCLAGNTSACAEKS